MFAESKYWREIIKNDCEKLSFLCREKLLDNDQLFDIERITIINSFTIRRLGERGRICTSALDECLEISRFDKNEIEFIPWRMDEVDQFYDMNNPIKTKISLKLMLNQMVHSEILLVGWRQAESEIAIFFSSDREKNKSLYCIDVSHFIRIMRDICEDYPQEISWTYVEEREKYEFIATCPKHPMKI